MPAAVVDKVAKVCDISQEEAEEKWEKAKKLAEDEGHKEEYDYIMSIYKNLVGKKCMKKMGWTTDESIMQKVYKYLL